jgi:transcription initiation factor TFIIIB Brf1 subunit/transcription initiation factor TFIIB
LVSEQMTCTTRSETGQRRVSEAHGAARTSGAHGERAEAAAPPGAPHSHNGDGAGAIGDRIKDEKTLRTREHQQAFQAWVYLLRRVANLPLQEVANRSNVSPSRISKIQRVMETSGPSKSLRELLDKCKAKN